MKSRCLIIAIGLLIATGCDPIGLGKVAEPVPDPQLTKSVHPVRNTNWSTLLNPAAGGEFRGLAVADFDGDGLPDIAAGGGRDRRGISIWLANGDGTWSNVDGPTYPGMPNGVAAGDIDSNKSTAIVVVGEVPGVRVFHNKNLVWSEGKGPTITDSYTKIVLADVNKDGKLDIIATRKNGGVGIWTNKGDGSWSADIGPTATEEYNDAVVADMNGDGNPDIIACRWGNPGGIDIWYGNGLGGWTRAKEEPAIRFNYQGVAVGDFNCDGFLDIAAASYRSDMGVVIFINDRQGGWWTTPMVLAGKGSFWGVTAGDFNNDGLMDVAATSFDDRGARLWLQLPQKKQAGYNSPQFLEQSWQLPHTGTYYSIATADFNADGRLDLAATTMAEGVKAWLQLDENGQLAAAPHIRPTATAEGLPRSMNETDETAEDPVENHVYTTLSRDDGRTYTEYRLGAGDTVKIEIYPGRVAEPIVVGKMIEPSGELLIPLVSPTPLRVIDRNGDGLAPSQLRDLIKKLLGDTFKAPSVSIVVDQYKARQASVLGEVRMKPNEAQTGPGQYVLKGKTRVLEYIADHGGFTDRADLTRVEVRRANGEKRVVDLFKAIFQSKLSQDIVLDDGDVVTIPSTSVSERKIYVLGEVGAPGIYPLQDNVTLIEAVQLAHSFTIGANRHQVIVVRGVKANPELFQVDVLEMLKTGDLSKNMLITDGDIVYVPRDWVANLQRFYAWFLPGYNAAINATGNGR